MGALFVFLGMFMEEGLERRGRGLHLLILVILLEGTAQFVVFRAESPNQLPDYACLHKGFQNQGYHPGVFEDLSFVNRKILQFLMFFPAFL